jgi:hypothetical protein
MGVRDLNLVSTTSVDSCAIALLVMVRSLEVGSCGAGEGSK